MKGTSGNDQFRPEFVGRTSGFSDRQESTRFNGFVSVSDMVESRIEVPISHLAHRGRAGSRIGDTMAHSSHRQHKGRQLCKPHKNRRNGRAVRDPWPVRASYGRQRFSGPRRLGELPSQWGMSALAGGNGLGASSSLSVSSTLKEFRCLT